MRLRQRLLQRLRGDVVRNTVAQLAPALIEEAVGEAQQARGELVRALKRFHCGEPVKRARNVVFYLEVVGLVERR